jgi:hypothetical protein
MPRLQTRRHERALYATIKRWVLTGRYFVNDGVEALIVSANDGESKSAIVRTKEDPDFSTSILEISKYVK